MWQKLETFGQNAPSPFFIFTMRASARLLLFRVARKQTNLINWERSCVAEQSMRGQTALKGPQFSNYCNMADSNQLWSILKWVPWWYHGRAHPQTDIPPRDNGHPQWRLSELPCHLRRAERTAVDGWTHASASHSGLCCTYWKRALSFLFLLLCLSSICTANRETARSINVHATPPFCVCAFIVTYWQRPANVKALPLLVSGTEAGSD